MGPRRKRDLTLDWIALNGTTKYRTQEKWLYHKIGKLNKPLAFIGRMDHIESHVVIQLMQRLMSSANDGVSTSRCQCGRVN